MSRGEQPAGEVAARWFRIDLLKPWEQNPRDHTPEKIAEVATSIARFGFGSPIVVRAEDQEVIAGHRRILAAQSLGWSTVPARFLEDLTPAEAHALALADNRLNEEVGWNEDRLAEILRELREGAQGLGWNDEQIAAILTREKGRRLKREFLAGGREQRDPGEAITQPGESFTLAGGRVLLVCGDALDPEVWAIVDQWLGDRPVDHVLTDPPYGVDYQGENARPVAFQNAKRAIDNIANDRELPDLEAIYRHAFERQRKGGSWHVFGPSSAVLVEVFTPIPPEVWRHTWVWDKGHYPLSRCDRHYNCELIAYGWKPGKKHRWKGGRRKTALIRAAMARDSELHPTQKPVELVTELLGDVAVEGEIVLDPFAGSGTTAIAAIEVGCLAVLIEISPHFCDAIRGRVGGEFEVWGDDEEGAPEGAPLESSEGGGA